MSLPTPIIRLEVDRMKYSILTALMAHTEQMNEELQIAVERYCESGHLAKILNDEVQRVIEEQVRYEVGTFFRVGKGQVVVREAIQEALAGLVTADELVDQELEKALEEGK